MTDYEKKCRNEALEKVKLMNSDMSSCFNHELCKKCGGKCCQYPCGFTPDQMKEPITYESMSKLLKEGSYSLDYWDADYTRWYYVRMRAVGAPVADDALQHHPCIMLTPEGCKFNDDERPNEGRWLIPTSEGLCERRGWNKFDMGAIWLPYNDILTRLWNEYVEIERPEAFSLCGSDVTNAYDAFEQLLEELLGLRDKTNTENEGVIVVDSLPREIDSNQKSS